MKKILIALAVLAFAAPFASAQIIDWNGNVVAGAAIDTSSTPVGHRADFMLSLNVTGFRIAPNFYFAGVGADASTVQNVLGPITTLGLSVTFPVVTYYPKGSQWLVQAGISQAVVGDVKPFKVYVGGGYGFTSPTRIAAKRAAKAAKKAAELMRQYPTVSAS